MRLMTKALFAAAGLMIATTAAMAGPADDAIKGRQTCMKAHGALLKAAMPVVKGETAFDAAQMKSLFDAEDAACADWAKFWGADTQQGETLKTRVKPEIWSDAAGFEAAGGAWYQASQKVRAATDQASLQAAIPALGESCKTCHEKYRAPEE